MLYGRALRVLARLEGVPEEEVEAVVGQKFEYVVSCQIYNKLRASAGGLLTLTLVRTLTLTLALTPTLTLALTPTLTLTLTLTRRARPMEGAVHRCAAA